MSEQAGRLDGLQAMIEPVAPAADVLPVWLYVMVACVLVMLLAFIYMRYSRHPLVVARRQYRSLKTNLNRLDARQVGEALEQILRQALGGVNIYSSTAVSVPAGLSQQEWRQLIDGCAQLRFSDQVIPDGLQSRLLAITQNVLRKAA